MRWKDYNVLFFIINFMSLLLFPAKIYAEHKVICVPKDCPTIQAAVDLASPSDSIIVSPGTYTESIVINKSITLSGVDREKCIIYPTKPCSFTIAVIGDSTCSIKGLQVNGKNVSFNKIYSLGLYPDNGKLLISDNSPLSSLNISDASSITSIFGVPVTEYNSSYLASCKASSPIDVEYTLNGQKQSQSVSPILSNISGNWPDGIVVLDSKVDIENCIVEGFPGCGIITMGKTANTNVISTTVLKCSNGILYSIASTGAVNHVKANNNSDKGICIQHDASVSIKYSECFNNNIAGIDFEYGGKGIVEDSICRNNRWNGICVFSNKSSATLLNNQCYNNGSFGIYVNDHANATMRKNQCTKNKMSGIKVNMVSTADIEDNNSSENGDSGVAVTHSSRVSITNNRLSSNVFHGIYFEWLGTGVVKNNICENNLIKGICIYSENTNPVIENNICRNNTESGIHVGKGATPTITNNECYKNSGSGIMITENATFSRITGNTCYENKVSGILVNEGAKAESIDNNCHDNMNGDIVGITNDTEDF